MSSCGEDGVIKIYNMYSRNFCLTLVELFRVLKSPYEEPISFAVISTTPLYSIYFFCKNSNKVYSYSINGQFLAEVEENSGFLYNMKILKSSSKMDFLVVLILYFRLLPTTTKNCRFMRLLS